MSAPYQGGLKRTQLLLALTRRMVSALERIEKADLASEYGASGKDVAASKRVSMDLTRALADYRQGRNIGPPDGI